MEDFYRLHLSQWLGVCLGSDRCSLDTNSFANIKYEHEQTIQIYTALSQLSSVHLPVWTCARLLTQKQMDQRNWICALSLHRTEVFYKETAFHNFYSIPSYIQRKKSSWIFFPNSLSTVSEREFLSVVFFIFKIFLRISQRVTMSSLSRIFQYFQRCFPFLVCVQGVQFFAHFFLVVVLLHKLIAQQDVVHRLFVLISHNINRVIGCLNVLVLH